MAIGSYPRVTVQGTGATNNIQNGLGLMVLNPSTGKYEAATAATFAGGGGGGDATAANQTTQINEVIISNAFLTTIQTNTLNTANNLVVSGNSAAQLLSDILDACTDIKNELISLNNNITDGSQRVVIQDTSGNLANVDSTDKALNVKTFS
jgi:hypothetical protein